MKVILLIFKIIIMFPDNFNFNFILTTKKNFISKKNWENLKKNFDKPLNNFRNV